MENSKVAHTLEMRIMYHDRRPRSIIRGYPGPCIAFHVAFIHTWHTYSFQMFVYLFP